MVGEIKHFQISFFHLRHYTGRTETRTCSDVKAMSRGTAAIPFSLTSGNILKRAISMAYMLDMAPPRVHSNTQLPFPAITNVITFATRIPIATGLESSSDTGEDILIGYPLNLILRHWLRRSRKRNTGQNHRMDAPPPHSSLLPTTDAIDSAFAGSSLKSLLKTEKLLPSFPACK